MKKNQFAITSETIRDEIQRAVEIQEQNGFIRIPCEELRDEFISDCIGIAELDAERRYHADDFPIPDYEIIVLDNASAYGYSI